MMRKDTYKWAVVVMLWFICFFNYADRQSIFSVFPLLKTEVGLTDVQLGLVASAFMWVYAGFGWIAGMVGDRFSRKAVILSRFFFWSIITVLFAFSREYWQLVTLRAVEGFGEAFYFPAAMSMISSYHGKETRSRAMGIHQSSVYAGTVAGGWLGGWMGQHYGWQSSFLVLGFGGIFFALVLVFLLKEPSREDILASSPDDRDDKKSEGIGQILMSIVGLYKIPMVWILTAVFVGANFVAMIYLVWTPKFLYDKFQMSLSMAGFNATAYLQVGSVLGVLCGGMLADYMVRRWRGGRMMTQSFGLFCGVPFIFAVGWTLHVPILVLALACFGFFKGIYDANIWASLHDVVPVERRATAVGVMNSIGWFGGGIATVSIAAASQRFGMSTCLSATSMIYLFFGILLLGGV
nr:MFS transporter [bacterium]